MTHTRPMPYRLLVPVILLGLAAAGGLPMGLSPLAAADVKPPFDRTNPDDMIKMRKHPVKKGDPCAMANSTIDSAVRAVLAKEGLRPPLKKSAAVKKAPAYIQRMTERFALERGERAMLERQGIVVLGKQEYFSFAEAFHEVFQSEVPLYVSVDAVFNAVYQSHDKLVESVETAVLLPALSRLVDRLAAKLDESPSRYGPETTEDLRVYLGVARHFLRENPEQAADAGPAAERIAFFVKKVNDAAGPDNVTLFGRERRVDFGQFMPRGHYVNYGVKEFFKAAMWLSRVEFNLVSRSCRSSHPGDLPDPSGTPREARAAMALADLTARSGASADLERIDRAWAVLAGAREDVPLAAIARMMKDSGFSPLDRDAPEKLIRAVGSGYRRTLNFHMMPRGTKELPAIATLIGPRIVADSQMLPLLHDPAVPGRYMAGALDVAAALGIDRARTYLADDLRKFAALEGQLAAAREYMASMKTGDDLYSAWLAAIRALSAKPRGATPSMMKTPAWADLRLNSTIAAYAELRHNHVLMAVQDYGFGGCAIPDSYVEPAPAVYDALIAYAERGEKAMKAVDPADAARGAAYYRRLGVILRVLRNIVDQELENRPLSEASKRFLGLVVEVVPPEGTGDVSTHTGWYFDLFYNRTYGLNESVCIADFYTSAYLGKISYAGMNKCRMGLFTVDTCGAPRVFAGPVARAFQYAGPMDRRLADEDVHRLKNPDDPWATSYTAMAPAPPRFRITVSRPDENARSLALTCELKSVPATVTIEYLDHNRRPLFRTAHRVTAEKTTVTIPLPPLKAKPEMVFVKVGGYAFWSVLYPGSFEFHRDTMEETAP